MIVYDAITIVKSGGIGRETAESVCRSSYVLIREETKWRVSYVVRNHLILALFFFLCSVPLVELASALRAPASPTGQSTTHTNNISMMSIYLFTFFE